MSAPTTPFGKLAALLLSMPALVMASFAVFALVTAAGGRYAMWPHEPYNLAEAAGVREEPEVVRLLEKGGDPNARYPVRAGLIFDQTMTLTPVEAAIARDAPEVLRWLVQNGAAMDGERWRYLRCIAEGDDVIEFVDGLRPEGVSLNCDGVTAPWNRGAE